MPATDEELSEETSVAPWRARMARQPGPNEASLAVALLALSSALAQRERFDEAVAAADEAVDLYEELAERLGDTYRDSAALAVFALGCRLHDLGQFDEA